MRTPQFFLEVLLGFAVPVGWAVSELVSLRRDRKRRGDEPVDEAGARLPAPPRGNESKP